MTHYLTRLWNHIKDRCYNPNSHKFKDYGSRGIRVYQPWLEGETEFGVPSLGRLRFEVWVLENLGHRPSSKHSLDRVDNNGNYEPGNLRWGTPEVQRNNRRQAQHLVLNKLSTNKTNYLWVSSRKGRTGFRGMFKVKGKCVECGYFPTPEQAYQAVLAKREAMGLPLPPSGEAEGQETT